MPSASLNQRYFIIALSALCVFYGIFELFFNSYAALSVDEFWFAHHAYQFKGQLPYRDFSPYKTVLGYYLLMLPMLSAQGVLGTLIFTKNMIALLNCVVFFAAAIWLTRFFTRSSVLIGLILVLTSDITLSYSTNIRVDLFAYWFCLFSMLSLLSGLKNTNARYFMLAGCLIGLGFVTSQKTIWYLFASNVALGMYWLLFSRTLSDCKKVILYNIAAAFMIVSYLGLFSALSSTHNVLSNVFEEAAAMYQLNWYAETRQLFWHYSLTLNGLEFLLWPVTLLSMAITFDKDNYKIRCFVIIYASIILLCLLPYKQVFPYYMQVTIPIFLVLYTAFLDWLLQLASKNSATRILVRPISILIGMTAYCLGLIYIVNQFYLLPELLLIIVLPAAIILYSYVPHLFNRSSFYAVIFTTFVFVGLIYPLAPKIDKLANLSGSYQQSHILSAQALLQDGGDYIAGIDLLYNREQPIPGLKHLMAPALAYLHHPTAELRKVMLPSLDENPDVHAADVVNFLKHASVKLYVNNYRMNALPRPIRDFLKQEYRHYRGSIYLYAPTIAHNQKQFILKFSGHYEVAGPSDQAIVIDNQRYRPGQKILLKSGKHLSRAGADYRLALQPTATTPFPSWIDEDEWLKIAF